MLRRIEVEQNDIVKYELELNRKLDAQLGSSTIAMTGHNTVGKFSAKLLRPALPSGDSPWSFVVLPKEVSEMLPRRGRTTVEVALNDHSFQSTLEPDGQLSHWLKISDEQRVAAGAMVGELGAFEITTLPQEPEPELPSDLREALSASPAAKEVWDDTTAIARVDWIHWIVSAKQAKTRDKRIRDACDKLASGKRRVCCFDPSGFYSKALSAPKVEE